MIKDSELIDESDEKSDEEENKIFLGINITLAIMSGFALMVFLSILLKVFRIIKFSNKLILIMIVTICLQMASKVILFSINANIYSKNDD
jgi:hypothetical protein